ncbi:MAG: DUF3232 domain-containing protein [Lachnospiraceae bacterium]|nr:DUF3232 domain-containing protein [Lachnospiraceae bacterium]
MKQEIKNLFDAVSKQENAEDAKFITEFITDSASTFVSYFNTVYRDVLQAQAFRSLLDMGRIDREDYIFRIQENDNLRRKAHDVAIDACAQINRQCDRYGLPHICPEKDANRTEIAEFIGDFVCEFYQDGIKSKQNSMDQAIDYAQKAKINPDVGYPKKMGDEECR